MSAETQLCDGDGIVRSGAMHHGIDYPCTGSAHFDGARIRCVNAVHAVKLIVPKGPPREPSKCTVALADDEDAE